MGARRVVLALALGLACTPAGARVRPLLSVLGTCETLTSGTYPADAQALFDPNRQSQVVFYAHLLFPLRPTADELDESGPWHPPLKLRSAAGDGTDTRDEFYAEAEWEDPSGAPVALYGLTFAAQARGDYVRVDGRDYIPHIFAMAIGTRDIRADAGQTRLPTAVGQYTVRLKVDGRSTGLSFFRILQPGTAKAAVVPAGAKVIANPAPAASGLPRNLSPSALP